MNSFAETKAHPCPMCGSTLHIEYANEQMEYVTQSGTVLLPVTIPYECCSTCDYRGFGEEGEKARTSAIYKYHDRLVPWEIVRIRTALEMSQADFAKLLEVGHASLERWERGIVMQNASLNNLILLLSKREHIRWLEDEKRKRAIVDEKSKAVVDLQKFRCLSAQEQSELKNEGQNFKLRLEA